ncbi:MAG: hypothetical protein ACKO2P_15305 [Planctomycetota bacterium]
MIRSEAEYRQALLRLKEQGLRMRRQEQELRSLRLSEDEIQRVLNPIECLHLQLAEEISSYERLRQGEFEEIRNFEGMGRLFTALRFSRE